jgi:hypothetical protein
VYQSRISDSKRSIRIELCPFGDPAFARRQAACSAVKVLRLSRLFSISKALAALKVSNLRTSHACRLLPRSVFSVTIERSNG